MFFVEIYWKFGEYKTEYVKSQTCIDSKQAGFGCFCQNLKNFVPNLRFTITQQTNKTIYKIF